MQVDLRRLEETHEVRGRLTAEEDIPFTDTFGDDRVIGCRVELSYERGGGAFFFHGELDGEFQTQCHQCLTDVTCRVSGDFDVVVKRRGGRQAEVDEEDDASEDLVELSPTEHVVSFDQHIYENLIVNIPMQVLCREDCKGLCPQCGIDRNKESCGCGEATDPRWDALRKSKNE
jgi:uncharacterized metal-binding protein YceD (DUF177 family)